MTDEHYRWQDHVPSTVGWKADLIIGVVFAAFLAAASVHHVQAGHALRQQAVPHRIRCDAVNGATHVQSLYFRANDIVKVETRRHEARDAAGSVNDVFNSAMEIPLCDRYLG